MKTQKWQIYLTLLTILTTGSVFFSPARSDPSSTNTLKDLPINRITSVSYDRDNSSERITIALKKVVSYKSSFLQRNSKKNLPFRLYVDLFNTILPDRIKKSYYPEDSNITRIRIAQRNQNTTRIVLDIENKIYREDYKVFRVDDPSRIIITLSPRKKRTLIKKTKTQKMDEPVSRSSPEIAQTPNKRAPQPPQIIQKKYSEKATQMVTDACIIVIDPGHGGKDPGAIGYGGIKEKDVCLNIALELKKLLDVKYKCKTILTRSNDKFLSLEKRAQIANNNHADFFISIHANSHKDESLTGTETYSLNFSSDANARRVAARENFTTPEKISDLEMILFDLLQSDKMNKSSIFAGYIHNALVKQISQKYKNMRNLGVKYAPMRVLIDVDMPGVLIETAFISNPSEAKLLKSVSHQKLVARAILDGIRNFANGHKTAYYRSGD